jgi:DNA-binding SARP family transcriptional activator
MTETIEVSRVDVLGGFALTAPSGRPIGVSSRKAQVLLAYLAHRSGQPVARAKIASMFWGDTSESEARHSLRQCLLVLRQTLEPVGGLLEISSEAVRLRRELLTTDAQEFERLVAEGTEESSRRAVALYRGEFLEGIHLSGEPIDEWIVFERRRLAHLMKRSLMSVFESSQSLGRVDEAIMTATKLLAIDPQQDDVRRTLGRLYGNSDSEQRSVVVATTDSAVRAIAVGALEVAGYAVRHCFDGAELLLEIGRSEPQLVILDATLPLFRTADIVRALSARLPHLPVICVGEPSEDLESEMLSVGAADYVRKPLDPAVLMLRVENATGTPARRSRQAQ